MTRIKCEDGLVHFRHPSHPSRTLCCEQLSGKITVDMFKGEECRFFPATSDQVNCPYCAKVVCCIRNEPYNTLVASIEDKTEMRGIYAAADPDGKVVGHD